jgi:hypothetical protein
MTAKAQLSRRASSDSSTDPPHTQFLHPTPHFHSFRQRSAHAHIHQHFHHHIIHHGSILRAALVKLPCPHTTLVPLILFRKSRHLLAIIMSASNNTSTRGATPAGTAQDNAAAYRITRPSTPPIDLNNTQVDGQVVPGAPRRSNNGR